jgi:transcriptional regulator with XRE-family HTH domain
MTQVAKSNPSRQPRLAELQDLGTRICELRVNCGLSQEALSAATGISRPTISKIETGREDVGVVRLHRLAGALEVEIGDFFKNPSGSRPAAGRIPSQL